jgi:hypothetical protein
LGWSETKVGWLLRATHLIGSVIVAAAFGLLLAAVFIGRKPALQADESRPVQDGESGTSSDEPRLVVLGRRTAVALLLVAAVAAIGLGLYWLDWRNSREGWKVETNHEPYLKVRRAFLADVEASRLDAAYEATTHRFRELHGRAEFEAAVRRFREFRERPGARNEAGENPRVILLPIGDMGNKQGARGEQFSVFLSDTWVAADGSRLRVSVTVVQGPDSFFYRRPPPIGVDYFSVSYVDKEGKETAPDRPERVQARGTWVERFVESLVLMSPVLVVDLVGVSLALVWWRRHPRVSLLTLLAIGLLVSVAVGGSFVFAWLPDHLQQRGWKFEEIIVLYPVMALIRNALGAMAYALLLGAIFAGRSSKDRLQKPSTE